MKPRYFFLFFFFLSHIVAAQELHHYFFVSPKGNDSFLGTKQQPFLTFERAQEGVRKYKKQYPRTPVIVYFREGIYYRSEPFLFTSEDSGTLEAPIVYSSFPGEKVLISGSTPLNLTWKKEKGNLYTAKLPKPLVFETLYINDEPQILARYPNYDKRAIKYHGTAADCISKKRVKRWKHPEGGYLHVMHSALWGDFHFRITGKDNTGELEMEGGWQNNRKEGGLHKDYRFVENIVEELDVPKEWYLDREKSMIYYMPSPETNLKTAKIEVTTVEELLILKGTKAEKLQYVHINGFTFERTARTFMKTKEPLLRSDWTIYRGATCYLENTENVQLTNCEFTENGGNSIFVSRHNKGVTIIGCHIHHIGASAICFVGDTSAVRNALYDPYGPVTPEEDIDHTVGPKNDNYPISCLVENNLIHDIGQVEKQVAGVQISVSQEITLRHNSIYKCPRSGINIGEGAFGGHEISFNDVFDTVLETSDHGSFNSWGRDRFWMLDNAKTEKIVAKYPGLIHADQLQPNVLNNNRMSCEHGWDIDLDDGSSNYIIINNLCLNNGIKLREGYYRRVENNICINNAMHPHVWLKNNNDIIRGNIFGSKFYPIRINDWGREVDYNWYLTTEALQASQEDGIEQHSLAGDVQFTNPKQGDFSIKPTSGAWKIGFKNFPMNKFGVQLPPLKRIAKTPRIPAIKTSKTNQGKLYDYYGGVIKNIVTEGELSATGRPNKEGILLRKTPTWGKLNEFSVKENDVLLQLGDKKLLNVTTFLKYDTTFQSDKKISQITVWRNQRKMILKKN